MWIRLLICVLVVAFCTLLGYLAAGKWRARSLFFAQECLFHERYLNELNYMRRPLGKFLEEYSYKGDFDKALQRFADERLIDFRFKYLRKEEQTACNNYFSMIGRGDSLSQKEFFSAQTATLCSLRDESKKEEKTRGGLYIKLGLLAGLAVVILIL